MEGISRYECLQVFHQTDTQKYLEILQGEFGARHHPKEPGCFLIGEPPLPFYRPTQQEDYFYILSFNYWPLAIGLIAALVYHPELVPPAAKVIWTAEQELIYRGKLRNLGQRLGVTRKKLFTSSPD